MALEILGAAKMGYEGGPQAPLQVGDNSQKRPAAESASAKPEAWDWLRI